MDDVRDEVSEFRKERRKLLNNSGFHRFDRRLQRVSDAELIPEIKNYLQTANAQLLSLGRSHPLRARVSFFPDMTFLHVKSPLASIRWNRGPLSLDRALVLIVGQGAIQVSSEELIAHRGNSVYLIGAGQEPVTIYMVEDHTEFVALSIPARSVDIALPDYKISALTLTDPLPETLLAPTYAFVMGVCSLSARDVKDVSPLVSASEEVVRLVLHLIGTTGLSGGDSLHAAAVRILLTEYRNSTFTIHDLASRLSVSPRTLQAVFKKEHTTMTATLREIRATAAKALKQEQPRLLRAEIAKMVGFGSVDALDRALREFS